MKALKLILPLILLASTLLFAQQPAVKIGVVDSEIILSQLPEYKKAQDQLNEIVKKWQAELDSLSMQYQERLDNYRKQEALMSEEVKLKEQQEIMKLEQEIYNFRQRRFGQQGDFAQKQEELLTPIKQNIIKAIEKVAKEEKVTIVFDKAGDVVVLYSDPSYDLTFKVLDQLRRGKVK
ncbi:MAG: OmpH family outer membrane protein [Ignavibacteria bacterium]|nr:OmpH family outer membrane protein [Ignavibacteria bacterium]MDH7526575.1 OmpH family outer membrane protein [Ignavibacteria bacterium]